MTDLLLRKAIEADWFLSPYEFCSWEDFERIKTDSTYYFLIRATGQHSSENEPAMEFWTLLKGSPDATEGISGLPEVLSLPLQPLQDNSGRIFPFLPAYVRIIQQHITKVIREDRGHFSGLNEYANGMDNTSGLTLLFSKDDFASPVTEEELNKLFAGHARLVLYPSINQRGSYCYKMILRADTYELLFYRKHKINARNGNGFLMEDIRRLAVPYTL